MCRRPGVPGCRMHEQQQDTGADQGGRGPREAALPRDTAAVRPMVPRSVREPGGRAGRRRGALDALEPIGARAIFVGADLAGRHPAGVAAAAASRYRPRLVSLVCIVARRAGARAASTVAGHTGLPAGTDAMNAGAVNPASDAIAPVSDSLPASARSLAASLAAVFATAFATAFAITVA